MLQTLLTHRRLTESRPVRARHRLWSGGRHGDGGTWSTVWARSAPAFARSPAHLNGRQEHEKKAPAAIASVSCCDSAHHEHERRVVAEDGIAGGLHQRRVRPRRRDWVYVRVGRVRRRARRHGGHVRHRCRSHARARAPARTPAGTCTVDSRQARRGTRRSRARAPTGGPARPAARRRPPAAWPGPSASARPARPPSTAQRARYCPRRQRPAWVALPARPRARAWPQSRR